jgi:hypothetical protein
MGLTVCASGSYAQDSQSLGDAARQARAQKQQKDAKQQDAKDKDASAKSGDPQTSKPAKKVVTNDDIPEHVGSTLKPAPQTLNNADSLHPNYQLQGLAADQWKLQFQSQKAAIASLQHEIDDVTDSIRYAGANCVADCVQWNANQKRKQDQVERMKEQLEQQQKRLEEMQEMARRQGLGSAIYDP